MGGPYKFEQIFDVSWYLNRTTEREMTTSAMAAVKHVTDQTWTSLVSIEATLDDGMDDIVSCK